MVSGQSRWAKALLSGVVGATTLTVIHETARRLRGDAPRMDTLGRRSLIRAIEAAGGEAPSEDQLQVSAGRGPPGATRLHYALVGLGRPSGSLTRGAALGAAAGLGAVVLPPSLGLGHRPGGPHGPDGRDDVRQARPAVSPRARWTAGWPAIGRLRGWGRVPDDSDEADE
ncbi:MAG: hypothetical protein U0790_19300 [Isosphaeraceae bacterium]